MLSYRHGFHAGNQADVLKHMILVFCLDYLVEKPKPLLYVDTHAGAGSCALARGFAAQNREWAPGAGALAAAATTPAPPAAAAPAGMIRRYLEVVAFRAESPGTAAPDYEYPGSPLIAAKLLRQTDRLRCFEAHPADFAALREKFARDRRFLAAKEDGLTALKSLLPPASRRGLVFIDPPYELKDEYRRVRESLREGLRRFPGGHYIVWRPLLGEKPGEPCKAPPDAEGRGESLMDLYRGTRCRVEFRFGKRTGRMYGCALVLFNPPWTLRAALREALPALAGYLGGSWNLDWEEGV
jgi:23S rRNA (adenine2030-N6)-methyltransferase